MKLSVISIFISLALFGSISTTTNFGSQNINYEISVGKRGSAFHRNHQPFHNVFSLDMPKTVPFDSHWLSKKLLPGDLVFFKADPEYYDLRLAIEGRDGEEIDYTILTLQRLANSFFDLGQTADAQSFVHVGIYIGNGLLLESSPVVKEGIRLIRIDDPDFVLNKGDPEAYKVMRIRTEDLRHQVVRVSRGIVSKVLKNSDIETSYSYESAFLSLFPKPLKTISSECHFSPKKGAMKPLVLDHLFCSYLVAWILQTSDYQINKSSLVFKEIEADSSTPSSLYQFILNNKNIFYDVALVVS